MRDIRTQQLEQYLTPSLGEIHYVMQLLLISAMQVPPTDNEDDISYGDNA